MKNRYDRLVVLNGMARSVVEGQRGLDPVWVFPHEGGHRLEAAGTSFGDCQVLLGHRPRTVTQRYMVAEIARLIESAERVLETERRTIVPLTIIRRKAA